MGAPAKVEIVRGEVTKVQFTSETAPPASRGGRARTVNRMRVFLRESHGAQERDFTFTDTTVGIHEGHTIAIVRAHVRGQKGPVLLSLINESTGQRDENEAGFARAARPYSMFGPRWRAFAMSVGLFVFGYILSRFFVSPQAGAGTWIGWPLILAFLAYPVFWGGAGMWEQLTVGRALRDGEAALRAEIADRLKPPPAPVAATPAPVKS